MHTQVTHNANTCQQKVPTDVIMCPQNERYSQRLQYVARLKKIDQKDLVAGLGKARSTVSKWWNGGIVPGSSNNRRIAEFIGCDEVWLSTGQGEPFPAQITQHHIGQAVALQNSTAGNISTGRQAPPPHPVSPLLAEIAAWLEVMEGQRPGFTGWFAIEFPNRFQEFEEWRVEQSGN